MRRPKVPANALIRNPRHSLYVLAVALGFYVGMSLVLTNGQHWWQWVLLIIYVAAIMVLPVRWGQQRRAKT